MAVFRAICFGTPNVNTQFYTNFYNLKSFNKFFKKSFVIFSAFSDFSRNLLRGMIIGHCIVSIVNGMIFEHFISTSFLQFFDKTRKFFLKFLSFFRFLNYQRPRNFLYG